MKNTLSAISSFEQIAHPGLILFNKEQVNHNRFRDQLEINHKKNVSLLTAYAEAEMITGGLPDLREVCYELVKTFTVSNYPFNALQFTPVLRNARLTRIDVERVLENENTKHVLVENHIMKMVLIHWRPGEFGAIHGHPAGGCIFKVLKGRVQEKRYSSDSQQKLLSINNYRDGSLAYIDDSIAYHAVENPFPKSAITLHVYTPGTYSAKQ